jgi:superfamily II DNA or RNA helicase
MLSHVPSTRTRTAKSTLTFDRGTLVLHPPPSSAAWAGIAVWDDRIERLRAPAYLYRALLEGLARDGLEVVDKAKGFQELELTLARNLEPYPHQTDALNAWTQAGRRGVVVLPTGAGKTFVAQLAMRLTGRSTLICVPTIDLMHQWYAGLLEAFPGRQIGLLGGGSREFLEITVATYDSAVRAIETHGNMWGFLVIDECHHLPGDLYRLIAEYSIAPYRLGLTATPERGDGRHKDLETLLGPTVYRARPEDLAGGALSNHEVRRVTVELSTEERERYRAALETRDAFLRDQRIFLGSLEGWQRFVQRSARSSEGRKAMLAHREARKLALATGAKIRALDGLLIEHRDDRALIFTDDNEAVYEVSNRLLIPAITHQTPVKERHLILERFREGTFPVIVASRVLNEGVDVPDANVAIVLSGTGSTREHIQRLGRILRPRVGKFAVLYEVVSKDTVEEGISRRRKGETSRVDKPVVEVIEPRQPRLEFAPVTKESLKNLAELEFEKLGRDE